LFELVGRPFLICDMICWVFAPSPLSFSHSCSYWSHVWQTLLLKTCFLLPCEDSFIGVGPFSEWVLLSGVLGSDFLACLKNNIPWLLERSLLDWDRSEDLWEPLGGFLGVGGLSETCTPSGTKTNCFRFLGGSLSTLPCRLFHLLIPVCVWLVVFYEIL